MAKAKVARLISFEQIETERLEEKSAINYVARPDIVPVTLHQIRWDVVELNAATGRLFVAPNLKFYIVALKLSLDHFRHFDVVAFEIDVAVARDWVIVD